nr:M56 family metallopeptidase [uncultured Oscillibacter sp.]
MSGVFKTVLSLSVSGSGVILALLLCGPLVKDRLSRRWQYYIWLAAVARLLLPLSPEGSPVDALFRQAGPASPPVISAPVMDDTLPDLPAPAGDGGEVLRPTGVPAEPAPVETAPDPWDILSAVWLGGALILLVRKITVYQDFSRSLRAGCREVSDPALLDRLARIGAEAGVRRPVELCVNPAASSPMLLGLLHPRIVLTTPDLPERDLRYTLLHELTHCRRRDLACKWLVQAAVCLHWFNPLVWLMARKIGRACELACDESVLRALDGPERRAYGDMLLRAAEAGGPQGAPFGSATLSEDGKLLKERLTAIMNFKKTTRAAAALSLVLTIAVAAGAAAAGAYGGPARDGAFASADSSASFYTQECYYQEPYLIELAWNIGEPAGGYASAGASLPGGGTITVYFADACKSVIGDRTAMAALSTLLGRLRSEEQALPITRPLVVSVRNIRGADPAALAERYYSQEALPQFGAVFALLDEAAQEAMLERLRSDDAINFLSVALKQLEPDSPLIPRLAERAYEARDIAPFSLLTDHMGQGELETWLARAQTDGRLNFASMLLGALDRDQELEAVKAELEARQVREYAAHGIVKNGAEYRYQGQLARVFLDQRANDSSFVTLAVNPQGTVDLKVTRDAEGAITAVSPMSREEAEALLADLEDPGDGAQTADTSSGGIVVRELNIPRLGPAQGGVWWLGEYELHYGDQIRYSVSARTGESLQVGFARGQEDPANRSYYSVSSRRTDGVLRCASVFQVSPPAEEGTYRLFVRVPEGTAEGVRGHAVIVPRAELEKSPPAPSEKQVLKAREEALAGMDPAHARRLNLVVKEANLWWEHQYLWGNIFARLENPEDLFWNCFDKTGEIQFAWAYDGKLDMEEICRREGLTEDQFYAKYGTPVVTDNKYTADDFVAVLDELTAAAKSESLRSALGYLREETRLAKEEHSMEHAVNEYKALHDLDYFLLRYGPKDVGPYVTDDSTISKYYGTLPMYST